MHVTQGSKTIDLTAGQMCMAEMNVVGAVDLNKTGGFTTTRFPRRLLLQVAPSAETQLARPLGHDRALSTMIERYTALCKELAGELDPFGQNTAMQHLTDLVGHFIETTAGPRQLASPRDIAVARLELMKAEILRNLERTDLTIEALAKANGLTTRQAQRMFASSGTTFTDFVLRDTDGSVEVVHETHRTGLFPTATWLRLLADVGFDADATPEHTTEDRPPRTIFLGHRPG